MVTLDERKDIKEKETTYTTKSIKEDDICKKKSLSLKKQKTKKRIGNKRK